MKGIVKGLFGLAASKEILPEEELFYMFFMIIELKY